MLRGTRALGRSNVPRCIERQRVQLHVSKHYTMVAAVAQVCGE